MRDEERSPAFYLGYLSREERAMAREEVHEARGRLVRRIEDADLILADHGEQVCIGYWKLEGQDSSV